MTLKPPKVKKHPGARPTFYGEKMIRISVYLPRYLYNRLIMPNKTISEALRLIMERDNNANKNVQ